MTNAREPKTPSDDHVAPHSNQSSGHNIKPRILLVGSGAVGRAIAEAHLHAGIEFVLADASSDAIDNAEQTWNRSPDFDVSFEPSDLTLQNLCTRNVLCGATKGDFPRDSPPRTVSRDSPWLVIESIPENLALKQSFFASLQRQLGRQAILCSNTSTLPIANIAKSLDDPSRLIGMHFFMPVDQRDGVEVIASRDTDEQVSHTVCEHAKRIEKYPLLVADTPGFVVNRMLGPYLNESLLLLCEGVSPSRIAHAAASYGMPLSPLELIDTIGLQTVFNAGSVYCRAFPKRIDPSPVLGRMIKKGRWGRAVGKGVLDWETDPHSLPPQTAEIVARYARTDSSDESKISDQELVDRLSLPMAIEAATMMADGTVSDCRVFDTAMRGGLGYEHPAGWLGYFRQLPIDRIEHAMDRFGPVSSALRLPPNIQAADILFPEYLFPE